MSYRYYDARYTCAVSPTDDTPAFTKRMEFASPALEAALQYRHDPLRVELFGALGGGNGLVSGDEVGERFEYKFGGGLPMANVGIATSYGLHLARWLALLAGVRATVGFHTHYIGSRTVQWENKVEGSNLYYAQLSLDLGTEFTFSYGTELMLYASLPFATGESASLPVTVDDLSILAYGVRVLF